MHRKIHILEAVDQPRADVWDALSADTTVCTVRSGEEAYQRIQKEHFDLVLVNLMLNGLDGLELLRRIKRENLCDVVVLTSDFPDFQYAQQGILYGAFDYLLRPLTVEMLQKLLVRVRKKLWGEQAAQQQACDTLVQHMGTEQLSACFDALVQEYTQQIPDAVQTDIFIQHLYESTVEKTFETWTWLALFEQKEEYLSIDWLSGGEHMVWDFCRRRLCALSAAIATLYPRTENEKLRKILQYLLQHIDDGCLQKDVAAAHYISNPSLSELFRSQLGMTYHAYTSELKLKRAQYLLRYSSKKIYEISTLLGYKDVNYFSRKFREKMGISLSQYRQQSRAEENTSLDYQI